jgi:aminoglycoside 6'-N-acetyltransferase I
MRIVEFSALSRDQLDQAARVLRDAFASIPSAFAGAAAAEEAVKSFVAGNERSALAMLDGADVLGWIGWVKTYSHAWELHPLAVDPPCQRRGVGTLLVRELEHQARTAGILTVWLGTDDEHGGTNLHGVDVFPDVLGHAAVVEQTTRHPIAFYRKLGFEVVGLLPDVNGFGKPDILMAKRLHPPASRVLSRDGLQSPV